MTATNADDGDDYQHWPDDESLLATPAVAAAGYDSHNGLHSHTYQVRTEEKTPSPTVPKAQPAPIAPQVIYQYPQPQMMTYPPMMQYAYAQPAPMTYPAPGYYTYAPQPMPMPQQPITQPVPSGYHVYQPAYSAPKVNPWHGRTKKEVEEDNMKIAAKEGAYDKRKVVPVGLKDDQMCWCVELDGSNTLRTYVSIKELKGEWKENPQYEGSYYFVRVEEEKKEKKKD